MDEEHLSNILQEWNTDQFSIALKDQLATDVIQHMFADSDHGAFDYKREIIEIIDLLTEMISVPKESRGHGGD